jgi:hypothetical protein
VNKVKAETTDEILPTRVLCICFARKTSPNYHYSALSAYQLMETGGWEEDFF